MRIRNARDVGILVREARRRHGLSQADLAKLINSTQTWVSWVENGKPGAEIGNVLLALAALGVEMDFVLPEPAGPGNGPGDEVVEHPEDVPEEDIPPYTI